MRVQRFFLAALLAISSLTGSTPLQDPWISKQQKGYTLLYNTVDKGNSNEYKRFIDKGIKSVGAFFHSTFRKEFKVFIHPSRQSLDSTWQRDWKMPGFKSECWMVASGIATRMDMISPKRWETEACEHNYSDIKHTQQLITHELVHIFHGQLNASPDFGNTEGVDWFVEGLATFASGQLDSARIADVKKAIVENMIPSNLENFWTGKLKYSLAGSVVRFIDEFYGREKLKKLLAFNKKSEILSSLETTEPELLKNWKKYIQTLK